MPKIKSTEVGFNQIRRIIRKKIEEKYGGVAKFLNSEQGQKLGGMKIKIYLYDSGPVNYEIISNLCAYLGVGKLTRKIVVSRSFTYHLSDNTTE